jgi:hypothetical protein
VSYYFKQQILFFTFLAMLFMPVAKAQKIVLSEEEKLSGKFTDVDILGKNSFGTVVYYFGDGTHQLAILDDNLKTVIRKDISIQSKSIESVVLLNDKIVVLYVQNTTQMQFFKAKILNKNLNETGAYTLDSLSVNIDNKNRFYAKTSPDNSKLLAFTIIKNKNNMHVRFAAFDDRMQQYAKNLFTAMDKDNVSVRSVKINNNGYVYAVFGYQDKWGSDEYDFSNYIVNYYNVSDKTIYESEIKNTNTAYKKLITDINLENDFLYILCGYKNTVNKDNIGFYYQIMDMKTNVVLTQKYLSISEEDVKDSRTYDFKNWRDKVFTLTPKKIIPRSDGGFIFALEGEFIYLRHERTNNFYNYYNPVFGAVPSEIRTTQFNAIGDIMIFSINKDGSLHWKNNIYKSQQSENDDAAFSSFSLFEASNVLKFIYNEDIFTSGNFVEYNVNPLGKSKRTSIMNTEKENLNLMPRKAVQLDARTLLIPSWEKRSIQFVQISY